MPHRVPGYRYTALIISLILLSASAAPVLSLTPDANRQPAAVPPPAGMLLYLMPSAGGQPPNTLHRVYPDETGQAAVAFEISLDVRRALISPDGTRFALQVVDAGNVGRIYVSNADGSGLVVVPVDATHLGLDDWHPSGQELLVWRFANNQYDLARLSLNGDLLPLTNTATVDERNGRWSPNGSTFSYTASGLGGLNDVFIQQVNGAGTNITNSQEQEGPAEWSPAGNRIVYSQGTSLVAAAPSGANTAPLDAGAELLAYGWSPQGEIYASDVDGEVSTAPDDGSGLQGIVELDENNWVADWGVASTAPLVLLPDHVNISVEQGAPDPAPVSILVDSEDFVTPWSATSAASWLSVNPKSGETPATFELSFKTANLDAGLYAAPVTFLPGPRTLNVTVAVNPPGTQSALVVAPEQLSFFGTVGEPSPGASSISLSSTGVPINWIATENAPWLTLTSTSGITPSSILVSVDASGLAAGRYESTVTIQPGGHLVQVTFDLFEPTPVSELTVSPGSLTFTTIENSAPPPPQAIMIDHTGTSDIAWSAVTSASWLELTSYSGITPAAVDVLIDGAGLPAGDYTGTIWIGQETVMVSLTVVASPVPPDPPPPGLVDLSVTHLELAMIERGAAPGVKEVKILSQTDQPAAWTARASQPWVLLSATSGTTPATLKVRADTSTLPPGVYTAAISIGTRLVDVTLHIIEAASADSAFHATWARQDLVVDEGLVNRTWLWGPSTNGTTTEPYAEAPGGERIVTYYDKSRMEITYPDADRSAVWYVTNGLLAFELITGQLQLGDALFIQGEPAQLPIAGDADDVTGPRYASFMELLEVPPLASGSVVTQTVSATGVVGDDARLAGYGVTVGNADAETGHTIASVFWNYLHEGGLIWNGAGYVEGALFEPWFFATGLPITEPYWARVKVAGVVQDVLIQCFERRCLTYTPDNPAGWRVEQANVGMHYFRWRYERPV